MASWIVHLRIAENLLKTIPGLDPSLFAIGNIAPDSGLPDAEWKNFDPPVAVTHFTTEKEVVYDVEDLRFYRKYLVDKDVEENIKEYSFLLGYFFHLVADNLWRERIGLPTKTRFAPEFEANEKFIWEVKKDWYGLDFIYVRDHPNSIFWREFIGCEIKESYLDILPIAALQHRLNYIKEYYQRQDDKIQELYLRPYIYLSKEEMDEFVESVSQTLLDICQYLTTHRQDYPGISTALALPLFAT